MSRTPRLDGEGGAQRQLAGALGDAADPQQEGPGAFVVAGLRQPARDGDDLALLDAVALRRRRLRIARHRRRAIGQALGGQLAVVGVAMLRGALVGAGGFQWALRRLVRAP